MSNVKYFNINWSGYFVWNCKYCAIEFEAIFDYRSIIGIHDLSANIASRTANVTLHIAACCIDVPFLIQDTVHMLSILIIMFLTNTLIFEINFWDAYNIWLTFVWYRVRLQLNGKNKNMVLTWFSQMAICLNWL